MSAIQLFDRNGELRFDGTAVVIGGYQPAVSCVLAAAAVDVHVISDGLWVWDAIYDNVVDFDALAAIPDGLGMEFAFDGSSADLAPTEAGVWAFTVEIVFVDGPDATWAGQIQMPFSGNRRRVVQTVDDGTPSTGATEILAVPADAFASQGKLSTTANATANPYRVNAYLALTRLY